MQGKDDSNKRIAELQKMRRSDYAKTWIGRRRIKIEIEKIKKRCDSISKSNHQEEKLWKIIRLEVKYIQNSVWLFF